MYICHGASTNDTFGSDTAVMKSSNTSQQLIDYIVRQLTEGMSVCNVKFCSVTRDTA